MSLVGTRGLHRGTSYETIVMEPMYVDKESAELDID
jgi:hypothetical protein